MRVGVVALVGAVITGAGAAGGCDSGKHGYSGIGPYRVDRTKLKDAGGRCDPTELPDGRKGTWCYLQPELTVAGRPAQVDLYFLGDQPDAPVIEIQLQVRGCHDDVLAQWLRTNFGAPSEEHGPWVAWQNNRLYLIGELPSAPGRCIIRVLPRSERAEFERLRTKALGPTPTPT
ncbi:MAG: hypothetical protein IPL61_22625 [Myxococcales bacterium]|nr:hypothetical protein [Myxococcales bacterium]